MKKEDLNLEVRAMRRLHTVFEPLSDSMRWRVINWLSMVYGTGPVARSAVPTFAPSQVESPSKSVSPGPVLKSESVPVKEVGSYKDRRSKISRCKM